MSTDNTTNQVTTPGVEHSDNFKDYFLQHDGLLNISREIGFTIFNKYMCKAGCKMCYLRDVWIPDEQFGAYVPKELTPETEARILEFFDWFETISVIDDLNYIKNNYPHLYGFYTRNAQRLTSSQMSDTAFIQQYKIMMEECHFKNVYEISFSDTFLGKKNGKIVDDVIEKLIALNARSPIIKLKVIVREHNGETAEHVRKFIAFATNDLKVHVGVHDDFTQGENRRIQFGEDQDAQQELNYYAQGGEPKTVQCEVIYLAHTSVVMTINDATETWGAIAYDIVKDGLKDVDHFVAAMMQAKIDTYARYAREITDPGSKHRQYFVYVSQNVKVDKCFNFVPKFVLKPWWKVYTKLKQQGWAETPYGLYDTTCTEGRIMPLFTFEKAQRVIPVVAA
jgi:hypothetical protein